ncbi:uncharacterized protein [Arachis hypogaea]|uniref:uncharacterized protein isoform X2 n=1 Tax=Arachis hypogaea TaxID=3818 RepID=UPI003B2152F7
MPQLPSPTTIPHIQVTIFSILATWKVKKSNKAIECTDITEFGSDDTDLVDELPDHSCLVEDEIPRVGMQFEKLKLVQDFYASYAKKVSFIRFLWVSCQSTHTEEYGCCRGVQSKNIYKV